MLSGMRILPEDTPAFYAYNAVGGRITSIENRYPDSGTPALVPGGEKPLMAAEYEDGTLCLYHLETGECVLAEKEYAVGEIASCCFAKGDEYFLVVTVSGRLDIYRAEDMGLLSSDTPEDFAEWVRERGYGFQKLNAAYVEDSDAIFLFIRSADHRLTLIIDTGTWTVTGSSEQLRLYDPQSSRLYGNIKAAVLSFPVYDLKSLKDWAVKETG